LPEILAVYTWSNGMVMAFDRDGEQMPEYQGRMGEVLPRIIREAPSDTKWFIGSWREGTIPISREQLKLLMENAQEIIE